MTGTGQSLKRQCRRPARNVTHIVAG